MSYRISDSYCYTMNTKLLTVLFVLWSGLGFNPTEAQVRETSSFSFGIQAGLNNAHMLGLDMQDPNAYNMRRGPIVGVFSDYNFRFRPVRLKAGVFYTEKGAISESSELDIGVADFSYLLSYIEMPLLLKYTPPIIFWQDADFVVFAGPYAGYNLSAEVRQGDVTHDLPQGLNDTEFGTIVGMAADGREMGVPIKVEARYTQGLTHVFENTDFLNSSWTLGVGYYFSL